MSGTPTFVVPHISPTSLDPPESTPHPSRKARRSPNNGFPFVQTTGGFCLRADDNRPKTKQPGGDPLDPDVPLRPITDRSLRPVNASLGIAFRHDTWSNHRHAVADALRPLDPNVLDWIRLDVDPDGPDGPPPPPIPRRLLRFAECGSRSIVLQHAEDPTRYKIACVRCHDRFCLPCMQDRARLIVANLKAQLPYEKTRFMTLTLKHSNAPLADQLDRLAESFTALRRWTFWKDLVTGGIAFTEYKLSKSDACWHPHLHILLRGEYIPAKLVSDAWLQITGDSTNVSISLVKSSEHLYSYLTKYVTKGWDAAMYRNPGRLREAVTAVHGRKLLISFGAFAHLSLLKPPNSETWNELGTLHEIVTLTTQGVPWAESAFRVLFSTNPKIELCVVPPED